MIEKLPSKTSEYWTFEDAIDNRIKINEIIEYLNEQERKEFRRTFYAEAD